MKPWVRSFIFLNFLFYSFTPVIAGSIKEENDPRPGENAGMVFVRVTVSDSQNRYAAGLRKEHFKITEDGTVQEILYCEQHKESVSVGIILDSSSSMRHYADIKGSKSVIARFIAAGDSKDDYLLITFKENVKLEKDFDQGISSIEYDDVSQKPAGHTPLYDAVYLGMSHVLRGKNDNKALILITDGEDNSSRYPKSEVLEYAKESDVQIYSISGRGEYGSGSATIEKIAAVTGGRVFYLNDFNGLPYYLDLVRTGLYNQYILGYKPANRARDGKWRRIKVKLDPPENLPKLKVHTREGYYAPSN